MKKLSLLFFVLFISFSFGQTEKKVIVTYCPVVEDNLRIEDENTIYNTAGIEVKPEYPGGIQNFYAFVSKNYKMPDKIGLKGRVYVSFVVEKNGALTNIKILRDIGYGTGKEVIRVLQFSPKWSPGEQNGKKIRCSYSLPISLPQKQ